VHLKEEHEEREQVEHVPAEPEDVHGRSWLSAIQSSREPQNHNIKTLAKLITWGEVALAGIFFAALINLRIG
jgi:hypothetical protein